MKDSASISWWWVGATAFLCVTSYFEAAFEIFRSDGPSVLVAYSIHVMFFSLLLGVVVALASKGPKILFVPTVSFVATFMFFSLRLNFLDSVLELYSPAYAALFVLVWIAAAVMFWFIVGPGNSLRHRVAPVVALVLSVPVLTAGVQAATSSFSARSPVSDERTAPTVTVDLADPWASLRFSERPNIYLLAFDALTPADVTRRNLSVEEPAYYDLVPGLLREIPRALTFDLPSSESLKAVMRLGQPAEADRAGLDTFSGNSPSILGRVARANSYRVVTAWPGYVPPWERGPFVDEVMSAFSGRSQILEAGFLCEFSRISRKIFIRGVFFCPVQSLLTGSLTDAGADTQPAFRDVVLDRARAVARSGDATIFFSYVFDPIGHVEPGYDHRSPVDRSRYRQRFISQAALARSTISDFVITIRSADPGAIIAVFGDHGVWMSPDEAERSDPDFFYSDRHRVFLGVANGGHRCGQPDVTHSGGDFNTVPRWLVDVFFCLGGGVRKLDVEFAEDPALVSRLFESSKSP
jgi:hypothetical protein